MERDANLIRSILLEIEKWSTFDTFFDVSVEGYTPHQIHYHVVLLHEAGLIEAMDMSALGSTDWRAVRLRAYPNTLNKS